MLTRRTHCAGTLAAVLTVVCLLSPAAMGAASQAQVETLLAGVRCEAAVRRQLSDWDAELGRALADPAEPTGGRSARVPTRVIGLWVRIVEEAPRELAVDRITATRIERVRFDEECSATEFVVATTAPPPGAFGDSDLITRIARDDRGVVLVWSPHMPLSVDQHAVLAPVARELGLTVLALLDPAADAAYAARVALERGLPAEVTRPIGGVELALRGMTTHTPSLQVFAGGRLVGPVLYGYRNADALRGALEAVLEEEGKRQKAEGRRQNLLAATEGSRFLSTGRRP